jgi:beta-1,4-mannosyltransferase
MPWLLFVSFLLGLPLLPLVRFLFWRVGSHVRSRSVAVVVLGDVGRSPRMMYHAQSFAQEGFQTFIIGYFESHLPKQLKQLPMAHRIPLRPFSFRSYLVPFILLAPFKVLWQTYSLFSSLTSRLPDIPQFIIVQVSGFNLRLALLITAC